MKSAFLSVLNKRCDLLVALALEERRVGGPRVGGPRVCAYVEIIKLCEADFAGAKL